MFDTLPQVYPEENTLGYVRDLQLYQWGIVIDKIV
jgi:hypothetical protein